MSPGGWHGGAVRITPSGMRGVTTLALLLVVSASGCIDFGEEPKAGVTGQLTVGPGVVFIERGPLYEGTFERAGVIDESGSFEIELASSGVHGFHAYVDEYVYLPIEIQVEEGQLNRVTQVLVDWEEMCDSFGRCEWVEQPTERDILAPGVDDDLGDNPVISEPMVRRVREDTYEVTLEVFDPNGDLSNQVLVQHIQSGTGVAMNPPGPVVDGNYPNGMYRAVVLLPKGSDPNSEWQFVAADHECNNSYIHQTPAI